MSQHSVSDPSTQSQGIAYDNLHLVIESTLAQAADDNYLLSDLPRWFKKHAHTLSFTYALENYPVYPWLQTGAAPQEEQLKALKDEADKHHHHIDANLKKAGLTLKDSDITGMAEADSKELLSSLEKNACQLLVIGTKAAQCEKFTSSSYTSNLTAHAPCPVLLLRKPIQDKERIKVLFATDGSDTALNAAAKLPEMLNAESMDVHLMTVQSADYLLNPLISPYINNDAVEEALESNSKLVLTMTREILENYKVNVVKSERIVGSPQWKVSEKAEELQPDLIVVGAHNRSQLSTWLLGSVSNRLLQGTCFNLLVCR